MFGFARLVRPAPHDVVTPGEEQLEAARRVIAHQSATQPNLALLRDKGLLFNEDQSAFIMYGVQGRTWVAMGDPVGPPDEVPKMISKFLARCDDFGGVPAFYEATTSFLHRYADFGMTFVKIGEEARIDLQTFTWFGSHGARFRQALRRLDKVGASFRILDPHEVAGVIDQLKEVSEEWQRAKAGAEKGFSLGFFDPAYLAHFPVAVISRDGRIEAFANLWTSEDGVEMSIDLMRHRPGAPRDVMETLIVTSHSVGPVTAVPLVRARYGAAVRIPAVAGHVPLDEIRRLCLQTRRAPLQLPGPAGVQREIQSGLAAALCCVPGGMTLPRVLADISALVAGGYRRIFLP